MRVYSYRIGSGPAFLNENLHGTLENLRDELRFVSAGTVCRLEVEEMEKSAYNDLPAWEYRKTRGEADEK